MSNEKFQIAVLGNRNLDNTSSDLVEVAFLIGKEIAKQGHFLLIGTSYGIGLEAAKGAKKANGIVIGVSPVEDEKQEPTSDAKYIDVFIRTGFGYKGRNVLLCRSADCAILVGGNTGSLNELMILWDDTPRKKPVLIYDSQNNLRQLLPSIIDKLSLRDKIIYKYFSKASIQKDFEWLINSTHKQFY